MLSHLIVCRAGICLGVLATVWVSTSHAQDDKTAAEIKQLRQERIEMLKLMEKVLKERGEVEKLLIERMKERRELIMQVEVLRMRMLQLQKELQEARTEGSVKLERSPPPEKVEGLVKEVEEKTGLMTLNIGSDAGLLKGNTLEVYRLDKDPAKSLYLGTVRLLDVRPTEAVGQMIARPRAPVQKGDRVASKIGP